MFKFGVLAACAAVCAVSSPAVAVVVTSIKITNALPDYLQVAEVVATQAGTGTNVALTGLATASSVYSPGYSTPERAIDGNTGGSYNSDLIFHSAGSGAGEYLLVTLAQAYDLSDLTIYGRTDCCNARDVYTYTLFNGSDVVGSGRLDASTTNPVSASFQTSDVPEPASWAMMVGGFALTGVSIRRKKAAISFA